MRIFVAGGAGYVGSHCVRALLRAGHEVTVFDSLVNGHRRAVDPQATFVRGDLGDAAAVQAVLGAAKFDAVMHFAGLINVGESVQEPIKYYRYNVAYTFNLLDAMRAASVRRMVFSSTCAVYSPQNDPPLVETMPRGPISPYGETKLAIEWLLSACAAAWGLGSLSLRYFNASGAAVDGRIGEDHRPETHLIPLILQVALGVRRDIGVFGTDYPTPDGTCVRDYIHVEDLADAHVRALEAVQPATADFVNIGTGRGYSVLEVIAAARAVTGHEIPVQITGRRPGDPPALFANADKARHVLGWNPRWTSIEKIVESAWQWHRTNPNGYAD